jgi:predicted TPR repeat methyltransferase
MLELAERRAVYDALDKAELVGFLRSHPDTFDVVLSADTLCYFGALEGVAEAAARAMRVAGHFVFTVEALNDDDEAAYRLLVHGRYAHGRAYLRAVLDNIGLGRQRIDGAVLRFEGGLPVRGWVVTASRE